MTKSGADLIAEERLRQINVEGHTTEKDEGRAGALMAASICYGYAAFSPGAFVSPPVGWPWDESSWKPSTDAARNLAKSGALAAAAIDSLEAGR